MTVILLSLIELTLESVKVGFLKFEDNIIIYLTHCADYESYFIVVILGRLF